MAAEAEAGRAARAKVRGRVSDSLIFVTTHIYITLRIQVIAADGEMRASLALAEASGVIHNSPAAIKLRHLQVCTYGGQRFDVGDSQKHFLAPTGALEEGILCVRVCVRACVILFK